MSETLKVRNPRNGEYDHEIHVALDDEIATSASRLRAGQEKWLAQGIDHRREVLQAWKAELEAQSDSIVDALVRDTGRVRLAKGELQAVIGMIDSWSAMAPALLETSESPSRAMPEVGLRQQHSPYPLLGVISPWNFPLLLSFIDAIPALLAGCAAIIKPSEVTPRFAGPVEDSILAVPDLQDVLAFANGDGRTGAALIEHVDVVAFTGSVATGRKVSAAAAANFIPAFLELGGKDPAVVLPGSDLERSATAILRASVSATGQACQSIERVYVHESQYEELVRLLSDKARHTPLTYPDINAGIVGPVIFDRQAEIIEGHIDDAIKKGAKVLSGGEVRQLDGGLWIEPTVLGNVDHSMLVMQEETFGPLMPVMSYGDEDEALRLANDSEFGLSAAVFAKDEETALRFAEKLDAGGISINDAGMTTMIFEASKSAFKLSGIGPSRMGATGLTRFLRQKALYINRGEVMPVQARAEGG